MIRSPSGLTHLAHRPHHRRHRLSSVQVGTNEPSALRAEKRNRAVPMIRSPSGLTHLAHRPHHRRHRLSSVQVGTNEPALRAEKRNLAVPMIRSPSGLTHLAHRPHLGVSASATAGPAARAAHRAGGVALAPLLADDLWRQRLHLPPERVDPGLERRGLAVPPPHDHAVRRDEDDRHGQVPEDLHPSASGGVRRVHRRRGALAGLLCFGCRPQSTPPAQCSRFQIGAVAFTSSMQKRAASNASWRCGADTRDHDCRLRDLERSDPVQDRDPADVRPAPTRPATPRGSSDGQRPVRRRPRTRGP